MLRDDVSMAHCVWLTDPELDLVARAGATVVHNPASNLKLGSGVARVRAMLERGVHVALGTDGPCSSDHLNMFESLRWAGLLHTSNQVDYRAWPSALQVAAHGHDRERTRLRPGSTRSARWRRANAPICCCSAATPTIWRPTTTYPSSSSTARTARLFERVIVNGETVVRDGKLTTIDEQALFREVGAARASLQEGFAAEVERAGDLEAPLREMYLRLAAESVDGISPSATFR